MHLMPSDAGEVATIVGIDPGTTSLGLCVLDFNVTSLRITSTFAQTFTERQLSVDPWLSEVHGNRYARIAAQKQNLSFLFATMNPIAVVCESPFFSSRFPQAYGALVEIVNAIRQAVWEYDKKMDLGLLDPPRVKQAVGAAGNAGKEDVKKAVLALPDLNYSGDIPLALLDEHSIDAIAVAHSKLCEFRSRSDLWNL